MSKATMAFAAIAWAATMALAFVLGRMSVVQQVVTRPTQSVAATTRILPAPSPTPSPRPVASATPKSTYPRYSSTIPAAFRGRWDEIVTDGCKEREARFYLKATTLNNFEVEQNVARVKLISADAIDIEVTGYDDDMNQYHDTRSLKLIDGGKTLTGQKAGASNFRRCPS